MQEEVLRWLWLWLWLWLHASSHDGHASYGLLLQAPHGSLWLLLQEAREA